jgi:hypothetical protein
MQPPQLTQPPIIPLHHVGKDLLKVSGSSSILGCVFAKVWLLLWCFCISVHRTNIGIWDRLSFEDRKVSGWIFWLH